MKFFPLQFIVASLVGANEASTIRDIGFGSQEPEDNEPLSHQRHLLQDFECTPFQKKVHYSPKDDVPIMQDSLFCALKGQDVQNLGVKFVQINASSDATAAIAEGVPSNSVLFMNEAHLDVDEAQLYVTESALVEVRKSSESRMKSGPTTEGTLTVLVLRFIDADGNKPYLSVKDLRNDIFTDDVCLQSQMDACSYGQLKIQPFRGNTPSNFKVKNGIVNVRMETNSTDWNVDDVAWWAAYDKLGNLDDPMFDLVMTVYPPGNSGAYALINDKYSWYHGDSAKYVALQMHEIGHNIGLAHSGTLDDWDEYGDWSGAMGNFNWWDDEHVCYNSVKNYQLKWFEDETDSFDPLAGNAGSFVLHGVADYQNSNHDEKALVALRMGDYYVGFNSATGIHADVAEDRNMVTIVWKEWGGQWDYGQSWKIAALDPGQQYSIQYNNNTDVVVEFTDLAGGEASIRVFTCKDNAKLKKFKLKKKNKNKGDCKFWAKKGKCNRKITVEGEYKNKLVKEVCAESCGTCG